MKRTLSRMLINLLIAVVVIYVGLSLLAFIFQSRMVYFPSREINTTPEDVGLDYEECRFVTGDGLTLHGWFIPVDSPRGTLLFCHGNAGNISNRLESIQQFNKIGLNVFIFDYRGYGKSEGSPGEKGTYLDAAAAWKFLIEQKDISTDRLIIFGRSLGGAVAVWLAANYPARALIVESSFLSLPDIAGHHYPYLPTKWISRFGYKSKDLIKDIELPKLLIHAPEDNIVPFKHGRKLYELAAEPKRFLEISGGHNDAFLESADIYEPAISDFISDFLEND